MSAAVPVTTTGVPLSKVAPSAGYVMLEVGATLSVLDDAATRFACSVSGWAPMSASRFTVACCMSTFSGSLPRSWLLSSPQDHCTVPAPKTSAPLGCL